MGKTKKQRKSGKIQEVQEQKNGLTGA